MLPSAENCLSEWSKYSFQRFSYRHLNTQSYSDLFNLINLRKNNKYFWINHLCIQMQGQLQSSIVALLPPNGKWNGHPTLGNSLYFPYAAYSASRMFPLSAAGPKSNVSCLVTIQEQDILVCRFLWLCTNKRCVSGWTPSPPAAWAGVPFHRAATKGGRLVGKLRSPYF